MSKRSSFAAVGSSSGHDQDNAPPFLPLEETMVSHNDEMTTTNWRRNNSTALHRRDDNDDIDDNGVDDHTSKRDNILDITSSTADSSSCCSSTSNDDEDMGPQHAREKIELDDDDDDNNNTNDHHDANDHHGVTSKVEDDDEHRPRPTCSICLCDVEDGEVVGELGCGHVIHKDCLKRWLQRNNRCPICQQTTGMAIPHISYTVGTAFDYDFIQQVTMK